MKQMKIEVIRTAKNTQKTKINFNVILRIVGDCLISDSGLKVAI